MNIYALDVPVLSDPDDDRDLNAVGVELMYTTEGEACFLLVRYFSLDPLRVEGDSFYWGIDDLLDDLKFDYGVSMDNWSAIPNGKVSHIRFLIKKYHDDLVRNGVLTRPVKLYSRDDDFVQ